MLEFLLPIIFNSFGHIQNFSDLARKERFRKKTGTVQKSDRSAGRKTVTFHKSGFKICLRVEMYHRNYILPFGTHVVLFLILWSGLICQVKGISAEKQ